LLWSSDSSSAYQCTTLVSLNDYVTWSGPGRCGVGEGGGGLTVALLYSNCLKRAQLAIRGPWACVIHRCLANVPCPAVAAVYWLGQQTIARYRHWWLVHAEAMDTPSRSSMRSN
jgi:hypothetical protein